MWRVFESVLLPSCVFLVLQKSSKRSWVYIFVKMSLQLCSWSTTLLPNLLWFMDAVGLISLSKLFVWNSSFLPNLKKYTFEQLYQTVHPEREKFAGEKAKRFNGKLLCYLWDMVPSGESSGPLSLLSYSITCTAMLLNLFDKASEGYHNTAVEGKSLFFCPD